MCSVKIKTSYKNEDNKRKDISPLTDFYMLISLAVFTK